jgi:hypothetical protein
METMSQTVTIERVSKTDFEKAFHNGQKVTLVKDPHFWKFYDDNSIGSRHEVSGPVGFTNAQYTLDHIYSDGPSRAGEAYRYWIVTPAEAGAE